MRDIEQIKGAYNAVAPQHITNKEFMKTLASVLNKPFWFLRIPAFVIKLIFGEMSDILLKGSRVSAQKIRNTGYNFKYPELKTALMDLLNNTDNS